MENVRFRKTQAVELVPIGLNSRRASAQELERIHLRQPQITFPSLPPMSSFEALECGPPYAAGQECRRRLLTGFIDSSGSGVNCRFLVNTAAERQHSIWWLTGIDEDVYTRGGYYVLKKSEDCTLEIR